MTLEHITSIGCAISILKSGRFISSNQNPLNGDAGMNCLNGSNANQYANSGVIMRFIWMGAAPIKGGQRPYKANELHDEGPWRLVVSLGTNQYLKFDSIEIQDPREFDSYLRLITPWYKKLLPYWLQSNKKKILNFFEASKFKLMLIE